MRVKTPLVATVVVVALAGILGSQLPATVPTNQSGRSPNSRLSLQDSVNVLKTALQNASREKYTQDVLQQHLLQRSSYNGNSDTKRMLHIYEENGLQYEPDTPMYQTSTRHWGWNGSSWVSYSNGQSSASGQHLPILSSLSASAIYRYFETFTATQTDPKDMTYTLVPRVPYDTQILTEIRRSLMPGSASQPANTVWDLSITLHLHLSNDKWLPTSDDVHYTWDDIDYLYFSNTVTPTEVQNQYTHDVRAVSLPHGAPPSQKSSAQQIHENAQKTPTPSSKRNNGVLLANDYVGRYHQNDVSDDKLFWARSSHQFYLTAENQSGSNASIQQGDGVSIYVSDNSDSVSGQKVTWYCDSPDVTWTHMRNTEILFQAKKPGIYTVQAEQGNRYSVPLVLVVGLSKLNSSPIPMPQSASGVMPLPNALTKEPGSVANLSAMNMMTTPWTAQGTWIPVSGKTNTNAKSMYVQIYSPVTGVNWSYQIPVNSDHKFGALLHSPSDGTVRVVLIPDYFQEMNRQTQGVYGKSFTPAASATYVVSVHGVAPSVLQKSLWASAWFDYNLSPSLNAVASKLVENSPSLQTAIGAISNQVSTELTYNHAEYDSNKLIQQDAMDTLHSGTGMCMDYSDVQVAMLNSVGIPTQILGGKAGSDSPSAGHVWTQVWNGETWEPTDVTFDGEAQSLTNAWFGDTSEFKLTHKLYPGETQAFLPTPSWG